MRGLLAALVFASSALGQAYPSNYPYLLRLDHYTFEDHSCALLQSSGDFHLEIDHGDRVKVFQGTIGAHQLDEIKNDLNRDPLFNLSQQQIEEPIIRSGRYDKLQVTVFRGDGWQDLFFRSSDSQRAFKQSLQPLAHWLDDLHKVPHRELSEDAGKNNCLPRSPIVLQIRGRPPHDEVTAKTRADVLSSNPAPQPTAPDPQTSSMSAAAPTLNATMLRMHLLEIKNGNAHDRCALVVRSGTYRFEERIQKGAKPVDTAIFSGRLNSDQLQQLRQIINDPNLAKMRHREHRGGRFVPILGNMLELSISRPEGEQQLVLSTAFDHPQLPGFYGGDGSLQNAEPLLKFLTEHVEGPRSERLSKEARNGCTEVP
ncbi:MAG TPA: hypothetical protein VL349_05675 [Terriglobales bacterium]|jgi:hypothetical protein|nr:hypothetical protein [Terriglobales bacterium]